MMNKKAGKSLTVNDLPAFLLRLRQIFCRCWRPRQQYLTRHSMRLSNHFLLAYGKYLLGAKAWQPRFAVYQKFAVGGLKKHIK